MNVTFSPIRAAQVRTQSAVQPTRALVDLSDVNLSALANGVGLIYDSTSRQFVARSITTSLVPEGSNLYHTTARVRSSLSAGAGLSYNSSSGSISASLTADDIPDLSGVYLPVGSPAVSAPVLTTPRTINGVSFDGSANITVTATASTLTGTTLASGVTASSLTSAAGGSFGSAAFTDSSEYDPAGSAAAVTKASLGIDSVENTALSTWSGSSNITTLGTITTGTVPVARVSGLGTLATQSGTFSGTSSGTNTGDQTSVTGNAGTATALQTSRTINGVAFNGTQNITVTAAGSTLSDTVPVSKGGTGLTSLGTALYVLRVNAAGTALEFAQVESGSSASVWGSITGTLSGQTDLNSALSGKLSASANLSDLASASAARTALGLGTLATQSGTFSGTSSGSNTGDQTTISGLAGSATVLANARLINGVSFDGSGNITIPAAASTLTGTTLASNVVSSSLTSAAGGSFGTAAFTASTAYEVAGAAAAVTKSTLGLGSVENTALSTWAGSANITTLGTVASGTWSGTSIADVKIASALTGKTYNALTLTAQTNGFTVSGGTSSKTLTVANDASVSGTNTGDQTLAAFGTAIIDFGSFPGSNEATVTVTGQTAILATSKAQVFIMADDTSFDHTANDHRWAAALVSLTCGTPTLGTGFPIYANSLEQLQGTFSVRWTWSD